MIKISALNEESEEDSDSEEEVTREALEQIALQQYVKALDLQRKGSLLDSIQLLKDLLDTELLYDVKKPAEGEKISGPLLNLKYLCYKNLAGMLGTSGEVDAAIEAYSAAAELDDTDVTLWHRLGQLCFRAKRYEMALYAFQRGVERNPNHWPCLDRIITLLLGLDYKEECISAIYDALKLDPDYLRGLVYRKFIYNTYRHLKDFMEYLNPIYKWDDKDNEAIDEDKGAKLLMEAEEIHKNFLLQQKSEQFKSVLPILKLRKPVTNLTWSSLGDSLVNMHQYMTQNHFSHACFIDLVFEKEEKTEMMEVDDEPKKVDLLDSKLDDNTDNEKNIENGSENENNDMSDKDKAATDTEKVESDIELVAVDPAVTEITESKAQKKGTVRRRGSALSFLEQWEWCNKRRSSRKKKEEPLSHRENLSDNIYDMLRRMVPICLSSGNIENKESKLRETSPNIVGLDKLFDEKDSSNENEDYFGTDKEQKDVEKYINKYLETKCDIIDMLKEYLIILAAKWRVKWPEGLSKIFYEANECYNNHIDIPSCTDDKHQELLHYTAVNLLVEEFSINDKIISASDEKQLHMLNVIESIGIILNSKPHIFVSTDCLELMLRYLWTKLHIHLYNKCDGFALDCLYQLFYEFEAMGEYQESYNLNVVNFTFKPHINDSEIMAYIKFLERNKKLSTVMDLYVKGNYEEVLFILLDSFEHSKTMARNQEEEMSLDFAVQLTLILDTYWALDKVEDCFKWSFICLHEALKHYFHYTSGSMDYDKWTRAVIKVLYCMEHILTTEGLSCLETISQRELSQGLEDLIRIIGHQVETSSLEMPFGTVIPWIIMHYILQREEDQGRGRTTVDKEKVTCDDVPNPLMVLFIAHEQLGNRGWCYKNEGKLLYFILDTVVPRLRSPALAKSLEQVCQYMEQCVYCLFGHPGRKNKLKYLSDHNVTPYSLDWERAQQVYEIFRPPNLPALEGKISGITADTEQLFHRILQLLPADTDPIKYVPDIEKYIKGIQEKLPSFTPLLPYKMKDIYFLLGDYYFKKEDGKMAVKYNMIDVIVNSDRLESWAEISLAKAVNLERLLNSCKNINNEKEFLNPAKSVIRCFKRSLQLDPSHCNMWIEYGMFVYTVHSFCSRLLKQASESLSMEDFESLEKQKEDMLDTTHKCFTTVLGDLNYSHDSDKENEDSWLHYYMLGKVAEKKNKPPSVYLDYYMKGVKSLQETSATYPLKINYNTPTHLCIEVLELHYRIHATILKYIEQHENKPIPLSVGKVFMNVIENWKKGPFGKKAKGSSTDENEVKNESKLSDSIQAANIYKRSISDAGEEDTVESKKLKLEAAAAKVKRSASYDTEMLVSKEPTPQNSGQSSEINPENNEGSNSKQGTGGTNKLESTSKAEDNNIGTQKVKDSSDPKQSTEKNKKINADKNEESCSSSSSSSTSDSSSSDSSSNGSSDSSRDSDVSAKSNDTRPLSDEEIMLVVSDCLDALEDCASRFPPHYKAIYRLAHYHFYYKKGKDIERCRDLMLSNFISRSGQKLGGLFSERKPSNFFNNIWKIPLAEVDRAGGFAFHMSRSVLLTMEILKEIDDHKTLLDLSLQLQRIPELDKKYVRDSDREELAQQAYSLCVQSLKGQLLKFSQQADLKTNDVERQALKSLMLDIYRAYQRAQKQMNSKQLANLLIDAYKLVCTMPINENTNLMDASIKYCQNITLALKQQATQACLDKSHNAQKKQLVKVTEATKTVTTSTNPPKNDHKTGSTSVSSSTLPKMSTHEMAAAFQSYLPMLNDPVLSQQTAAALQYLNSINALASYQSMQNTIQSSLQNTLQKSFQAEFYRQFLGQTFSSYNIHPPKKQKRANKPTNRPTPTAQLKSSKSCNSATAVSMSKATPTPVITSLHKSTSLTATSSIGAVIPSMSSSVSTVNASFAAPAHSTSHTHSGVHSSMPAQAHMSSASTVAAAIHTKPPMPHHQVSPGKTLQEKLAEKQKNLPSISKTNSQELNASLGKLPSSLTIIKTNMQKPAVSQAKKTETKKSLPFKDDEVIVLDDD